MLKELFCSNDVLSMLAYLGAASLIIYLILDFFDRGSEDSFYRPVDFFDKDRSEPKRYAHRSRPRSKTHH